MPSNSFTYDQLEEEVQIDDTNIDAELIKHPHIFFHISAGHADALSQSDLAKHRVEIFEADLYLEIRRKMVADGDKFTETLLEKMVNRDDRRIALVDRYLEAKHTADKWRALKDSFIQKGYMLKDIIDNRKSDNVAEGSYSRQRHDAMERYGHRNTRNTG